MKTLALLLVLLVPAVHADQATELADKVIAAAGGEMWPRVKVIEFTFNVADGEKVIMTAKHTWDVWKNTDTVTWKGKTVTVDLGAPNADGDAKAAFQRWTNDAYWLLAPLKLRDHGVHLKWLGRDKNDALEATFDGVGLTPKDKYVFFINPDSHLVTAWQHWPTPEKKNEATWENYQEFGGLKLSTEHAIGGGKRLYFTDVKVTPGY